MIKLPQITDIDVTNKKVIVRGDLDISEINENDLRLKSLIPTLRHLLDEKAKVILIGHRGRPEGKITHESSLKSTSEVLEKKLNTKINFVYDIAGAEAKAESEKLQDGEIMMLENLRFDSREEANDDSFAKSLAGLGEIYINEAFSVCHREHASIVGIPKYLPHFAGLNLSNEVENLSKVTNNPERPLVILISGIKKDKLEMIKPLSELADKVLVGGRLPAYAEISNFQFPISNKILLANLIPDKEDITLNTIEKFKEEISKAKTIVLAGVLGRYEDEGHTQGTRSVFDTVASSSAFKIVGGGDSLTAIIKFNLTDKFEWVSVGGGAMLEFLTKKSLPGIEVLLH